MKHWCFLMGRKKDNKGASIVMVLVIMAVVMILALIVMSMALVNARMKSTRQQAQKDFYDAETAVEEIRLGIANEMSDALAVAYVDTVQRYSELEGDARDTYFKTRFLAELKANIGCQLNGTEETYQPAVLQSYLKYTKYEEWEDGKAGAQVTSGNARVNTSATDITLKDVVVTYWGEEGYSTRVCTDFVIECPDIYFSKVSKMPDLTSYALVTADHLEVESGAGCEITGNAYIGENDTVLSNASLSVKNVQGATERGMVVSGGLIKGEQNANVSVSDMEVWAENLAVDSSKLTALDTAVYLKNDFVLSNSLLTSSQAKLSGEFFGYGNTKSAASAESVAGNSALLQEIAKKPADYSSSVIINGISSSLDFSGLSVMKISGNAYINTEKEKSNSISYSNLNAQNVLMGSSLSVRADQIAYLVPAECVAPDLIFGGTNPMPISQYSMLLTELEETYGDAAESCLVDLSKQTTKYGVSLQELGVSGWQIAAHQVNGVGSMVYIFLEFDMTEDANAFYQKYYDVTDRARLGELLDLYSGTGIKLPAAALSDSSNSSFYFNGNVLASDAAKLYVPDSLSEDTSRSGILAEEIANQDTFAALNTKLMKDYAELTQEETKNGVYENLVKSMVSAENSNYTIGVGTNRIFVKTTGEAAVIANGDCTVGAELRARIMETPDSNGDKHADAKLAVVIAAGDITVTEDFKGLLLSGGTIRMAKRNGGIVSAVADREAACAALLAESPEGIHAYEYLVGGESYVISGSVEGTSDYTEDSFDMLEYIGYKNWSRQ